jgi:hypothetical protein
MLTIRGNMKVDEVDLKKINERMKDWTVDKVESGNNGEDVFIFHLKKGTNSKRVILCANDLGGWIRSGS